MRTSRAIWLDAGGSAAAAIGLHEVIEVVTESDMESVPLAPAYCRELLQWRNQWVPVFDLAAWRGLQSSPDRPFLVIVGYAGKVGGGFQYGCLRVSNFPKIVELSDEHACGLPAGAKWDCIAHSCFRGGGREVPILSLYKVFQQHEAGTGHAVGVASSG